jgi:hypothetical protein
MEKTVSISELIAPIFIHTNKLVRVIPIIFKRKYQLILTIYKSKSALLSTPKKSIVTA